MPNRWLKCNAIVTVCSFSVPISKAASSNCRNWFKWLLVSWLNDTISKCSDSTIFWSLSSLDDASVHCVNMNIILMYAVATLQRILINFENRFGRIHYCVLWKSNFVSKFQHFTTGTWHNYSQSINLKSRVFVGCLRDAQFSAKLYRIFHIKLRDI